MNPTETIELDLDSSQTEAFVYWTKMFLQSTEKDYAASLLGHLIWPDSGSWYKVGGHLYSFNKNVTISASDLETALRAVGRGASRFVYSFEIRQGKPAEEPKPKPEDEEVSNSKLLKMTHVAIARNLEDGGDAGTLEALLKLKESLERL